MTRHEKALARRTAIADIKEELKKNGKTFMAFATTLNPVMDALVEQYVQQQNLII